MDTQQEGHYPRFEPEIKGSLSKYGTLHRFIRTTSE